MILTDGSISKRLDKGDLVIDPYDPEALQPSSVDLRIGPAFRVFTNHRTTDIDLRYEQPELTTEVVADQSHGFVLHPREFVLAATMESIGLPADLVGRLEGRSSLGRVGLLIHSTAGFVDPGWSGTLTLELANVSNLPIRLFPGMRVAQLSLFQADAPALRPYGTEGLGSKYQGQVGPTPSRYFQETLRD